MNPSDQDRDTTTNPPVEPTQSPTSDTYEVPQDATPAQSIPQDPISTPLVQPSPVPQPETLVSTEPVVAPIDHKAGKRRVILLVIAVTLFVAIGVVGYFFWQISQPVADTQTNTAIEETVAPVESGEDITAESEALNSELEALDASEFEDSTLNDSSLSQ